MALSTIDVAHIGNLEVPRALMQLIQEWTYMVRCRITSGISVRTTVFLYTYDDDLHTIERWETVNLSVSLNLLAQLASL